MVFKDVKYFVKLEVVPKESEKLEFELKEEESRLYNITIFKRGIATNSSYEKISSRKKAARKV